MHPFSCRLCRCRYTHQCIPSPARRVIVDFCRSSALPVAFSPSIVSLAVRLTSVVHGWEDPYGDTLQGHCGPVHPIPWRTAPVAIGFLYREHGSSRMTKSYRSFLVNKQVSRVPMRCATDVPQKGISDMLCRDLGIPHSHPWAGTAPNADRVFSAETRLVFRRRLLRRSATHVLLFFPPSMEQVCCLDIRKACAANVARIRDRYARAYYC